jgi:hypothetical protein
VLAGSSFGALISTIAFWDGVGRLVLDTLLILVLFVVVMTVAGHPPSMWSTRRQSRAHTEIPPTAREEPTDAPLKEGAAAKVSPPQGDAAPRRQSTATHLEVLDKLRTTFQYQASTVVLIVFAVILLGIQRILGATEIATILAGIAGFVLGQNKGQSDVAAGQTTQANKTGAAQENANP